MAVRANSRGRADWGKAYKGFSQALAEAGKTMTKQGATIMTRACEDWLKEQDEAWPRKGDYYYPWYSGNLHDSLATRIADGNRTISIRQMRPGAYEPSYDDFDKEIIGSHWGLIAATRGQYVFLPGLQAQLYIGVPYANKVNEMPTHRGYIEEFERDFATTMESRMSEIRNLVVRTK